jgi:hypothetical protein
MSKPSPAERLKYGASLYEELKLVFPDGVRIAHVRDGNDLLLALDWESGDAFRQIGIRVLWEALDDFLLRAQYADASRVKLVERLKEIRRDVRPITEEQRFEVRKDDVRLF